MISSRHITEYDYGDIEEAIQKDPYHRDTTKPEFFYEPGTICNVYCDEQGPIFWVRGSSDVDKNLRLDIQYRRNKDVRRNKEAMDIGLPLLEERAKVRGFRAFLFESTSPHLIKYCTEQLGFTLVSENLLRKEL